MPNEFIKLDKALENFEIPTEEIENSKKEIENSQSLNNGGNTDYYALPRIHRKDILNVLELLEDRNINKYDALERVYALLPATLNDLIEYKNMKPWQHEVFKACYALEERARKNPDAGSSRIREINKILYYANRGLKLETN